MKDEDWGEEVGFHCCDCRHFYGAEDEEKPNQGECRRFPPTDWFEEVGEAIWPRVAGYQHCGEFELDPVRRRRWQDEKRDRISGRRK